MRALRLAALWTPLLGVALAVAHLFGLFAANLLAGLLADRRRLVAYVLSSLVGGVVAVPVAVVARLRERPGASVRHDLATGLLAALAASAACVFYLFQSDYTFVAIHEGTAAALAGIPGTARDLAAHPVYWTCICAIPGIPYGATIFLHARRTRRDLTLLLVPLASAVLAAPWAVLLLNAEQPGHAELRSFAVSELFLCALIPATLERATKLEALVPGDEG